MDSGCQRWWRVLLPLLLLPLQLRAHGEAALGPNGGYIQMPGGFHTELKIEGRQVIVYLLDINFKNPMTKKSTLKIQYVNAGQNRLLTCSPQSTAFQCELPIGFRSNQGKFILLAERDGIPGAETSYQLPLQLRKKNEIRHAKPQAGHQHSDALEHAP